MGSFQRFSTFAKFVTIALFLTACAIQPITNPSQPTTVPPTAVATLPASPTPITFTTADGVTLQGTLYGQGTTAVVFSAMGAHRQETWAAMAQTVADQGYLALIYNYRFWVTPTHRDESLYQYSIDDLRAAIALVREQGASNIVLVGASWGGMLTAQIAGSEGASAVVIMASPLETKVDGRVVRVTAEDLQAIAAPKLFLSSENDNTVPMLETQRMYDLAAQPKEFQTLAGTAHGTDNFGTKTGEQLKELILAFLLANVPPSVK